MARVNFAVEQGYEIYDINGNILTADLAGSLAPGGDTGPQDAAPIGSVYKRTSGEFYVKTANAGAAADWVLVPVQLSAGYTPVNGAPTIGDSIEEAIEKLDGNQQDIQTASGIAQGDVDYGTFTGVTIPDNSTSKGALQALESALEAIEGGFAVLVSGITTLQDIDTILVDNVHAVEWEIAAWEEATPSNKIFQKITALHNGTASADATVADDSIHTKLKVGSSFNLAVVVDVSGAGASQVLRLRASSSTAGVAMEVRRTGVLVNN